MPSKTNPNPKPSPSTPPTIGENYAILPITLPPQPSFSHPSATHYLYIRPHSPKIPDVDTSRSLFIVNVPVDATVAHVRALFAEGRVERVEFLGRGREEVRVVDGKADGAMSGVVVKEVVGREEGRGKKRKRGAGAGAGGKEEDTQRRLEEAARLPATWDRELSRSGASAVVVFVDRGSMEAVWRAVRKRKGSLVWGKGVDEGKVGALGSKRYQTHHTLRYPSRSTLQSRINSYMTLHSAHATALSRRLARNHNVPDEEGFITVTSSSSAASRPQRPAANANNPETLSEDLKRRLERQKEKMKGEDGFYRFQVRERLKERERGVREGFGEDLRRVRAMRGVRMGEGRGQAQGQRTRR